MEKYDVVIIGGGIAGTGLAYNLSKECPEKKVLLIEKDEIGSNAGYGYRIVFKEMKKRYHFPYYHKYKGLKIGVNDKTHFTINDSFYLCDYKKICSNLFKKSNAKFRKEEVLRIYKHKIKTNKSEILFTNMIDCSGSSFLLKRNLGHKKPIRYWIGDIRTIKNKRKVSKDYFYYMFDDSGFMEDYYPLEDKILQGNWQYTKKIDFRLIKPPKSTLLKKHNKIETIKQEFVVDPVSPSLPIVYGNCALLGDSFGNATPSSGVGIDPILESSEILAKAIKCNNLLEYEKKWKNKYIKKYSLSLASRLDRYHNNILLRKIKNYPPNTEVLKLFRIDPPLMVKLLKNQSDFKLPSTIKKKYPSRQLLFIIFYYLYIRINKSFIPTLKNKLSSLLINLNIQRLLH